MYLYRQEYGTATNSVVYNTEETVQTPQSKQKQNIKKYHKNKKKCKPTFRYVSASNKRSRGAWGGAAMKHIHTHLQIQSDATVTHHGVERCWSQLTTRERMYVYTIYTT